MRLWRRSATDMESDSRVAPIAFRKPSAARSPPTLRILSLNTGSYSTQCPSPSTIGWSIFERTCSGVMCALMICSGKVAAQHLRLCGPIVRAARVLRHKRSRPSRAPSAGQPVIYAGRHVPFGALTAAASGTSVRCVGRGRWWDLPMGDARRRRRSLVARSAGEPRVDTVEVEKDDRRRIEGQRLADDQPADDRIAEWLADLRPSAGAEHQRNPAEECGHRRHHDRPEAQETRLADRVDGCQTATALRLDREIDQHDAVLFDDADQQDDAD